MMGVYKLYFIGAAVLALSLGGWWLHNKIYQKGYNQHRIEAEAATAKVLATHTAEMITKGVQHDKDSLTIARLAADSRKLQVKFAAACSTVAAPASADGAGGVLPNRMDEAFAALQAGIERLAERADKMNIDVIRSCD